MHASTNAHYHARMAFNSHLKKSFENMQANVDLKTQSNLLQMTTATHDRLAALIKRTTHKESNKIHNLRLPASHESSDKHELISRIQQQLGVTKSTTKFIKHPTKDNRSTILVSPLDLLKQFSNPHDPHFTPIPNARIKKVIALSKKFSSTTPHTPTTTHPRPLPTRRVRASA